MCWQQKEKVGKSLLSTQIALNVAGKGNAVGVVSLEMKASEIAGRLGRANERDEPNKRLEAIIAFDEQARHCRYTLLQEAQNMTNSFDCSRLSAGEKDFIFDCGLFTACDPSTKDRQGE